ncbi:hypothetical protein [Candidatus Poriferisodalis sp.]|uniref:hypothetical protein n=1 Tax=Candidatus Poriferisodalis sp. TaxID=3101277 RepID=UPI003B51A16F
MTATADSIPVAYTPTGGWTQWPPPVLAGCTEPLCEGAPDMRGFWRIIEVIADGAIQPDHPALGRVQRIEQAGNRVVVTGAGIVHDMRCDGTLRNGVHDVAEFDKSVEIHVIASFEDDVHVLRPYGLDIGTGPIEIRRWRDGAHLMWDYLGFTARLQRIAPPDADPEVVFAEIASQEQ